MGFQALRKGQPGTPSPDREFRTSDLIVVRAAVAGSGDGNPQVTAEVLTRQGKPLAKWPASLVAGAAPGGVAGTRARARRVRAALHRPAQRRRRRDHRGFRDRALTAPPAMLVPVVTLDAPGLEGYRHVAQPDRLAAAGHFVAEGRLVVARLIALGTYRLHSLLLTTAAAEAMAGVLPRVPAHVPVYVASHEVMNGVVGFNIHRGCLALAERPAGRRSRRPISPPPPGCWCSRASTTPTTSAGCSAPRRRWAPIW